MGVKYICGNCDAVFDEVDGTEYDESTGRGWIRCPHCGEEIDIEECVICEECGEPVENGSDFHGLCRECAKEKFLNEQNIKDYLSSKGNFDDFVEFLFDNFSESTIVDVMYDAFEKECTDYCEKDLDWFVDFVDR